MPLSSLIAWVSSSKFTFLNIIYISISKFTLQSLNSSLYKTWAQTFPFYILSRNFKLNIFKAFLYSSLKLTLPSVLTISIKGNSVLLVDLGKPWFVFFPLTYQIGNISRYKWLYLTIAHHSHNDHPSPSQHNSCLRYSCLCYYMAFKLITLFISLPHYGLCSTIR